MYGIHDKREMAKMLETVMNLVTDERLESELGRLKEKVEKIDQFNYATLDYSVVEPIYDIDDE
jgi:hypothetical protein